MGNEMHLRKLRIGLMLSGHCHGRLRRHWLDNALAAELLPSRALVELSAIRTELGAGRRFVRVARDSPAYASNSRQRTKQSGEERPNHRHPTREFEPKRGSKNLSAT